MLGADKIGEIRRPGLGDGRTACAHAGGLASARSRVQPMRSDPALRKAPANTSSGTGSKERNATGRKHAPTHCSPSDAASKTGVGPTSSIGGLAARPPPDQRKWTAPLLRQRLCLRKPGRISGNICLQRKARPAIRRGELFRFNQAQKI